MKHLIPVVLFIVGLGSCVSQNQVLRQILSSNVDNREYSPDKEGWFCSSKFLQSTNQHYILYSDEQLMDSLEPGTCPKNVIAFCPYYVLSTTINRFCEGGEPPKGYSCKWCKYPYSVVKNLPKYPQIAKELSGKRALVIELESFVQVYRIDEIQALPNSRFVIKLTKLLTEQLMGPTF